MKKICPSCNYETENDDIFCPKCGNKLELKDNEELIEKEKEFIKEENEKKDSSVAQSQRATLENMNFFLDAKKTEKAPSFGSLGSMYDGGVLNFVVSLIIVSVVLFAFSYLIIQRQAASKLELRYKSMISNKHIPLLKNPTDFTSLDKNIRDVEQFLSLYLKFSNDSIQKKEQIFISYLFEVDKFVNITSENMVKDDLDKCSSIQTHAQAQKCASKFSQDFSNTSIMAYALDDSVYLAPNYKFIYSKYGSNFSEQMQQYLRLRAKYNTPVVLDNELYIKPNELAAKIRAFEKLLEKTESSQIADIIQFILYKDVRAFLFSPSIYDTQDGEMNPAIKSAYQKYIKSYTGSQLRPLIMSCLEKNKQYSEQNFKNDYPYKNFEDMLLNTKATSLQDVFVRLRKNMFQDNSSKTNFMYIYNSHKGTWDKYTQGATLDSNDFIISTPDENGNITMFNNTYAQVAEANVARGSKPFLRNNVLYFYDPNKLEFSRVNFKSGDLRVQTMSNSDITSIFPGAEIINIDSYQNYNISIEKDNADATYVIVSKYTQGYENYTITALKGEITTFSLPNIFSINSNSDTMISFHSKNVSPETSTDNTPTYKIVIKTRGYSQNPYEQRVDEMQDFTDSHNPNIMPKIINENRNSDYKEPENTLMHAPTQKLEPPNDLD